MEEQYTFSLNLPEGYSVEELPESVRVVLPNQGAAFTFQTRVAGPMLQVVSTLQINQTIFSPEAYPQLREFFDLVVSKHAEQIVLSKANTLSGDEN